MNSAAHPDHLITQSGPCPMKLACGRAIKLLKEADANPWRAALAGHRDRT